MSVALVGVGVTALGAIGSYSSASKAAKNMDAATAAQMESAKLQNATANRNLDMQEKQFDYFKERQVGVDATAEEVTRRQLAMAEETADQGRDLYNYQKDVFRPVEQSMVSQAMRESTPEYYEQYAQKAMAAQAAAQANALGQTERNMASMGVNPNSGAYQSQMRGLQLGNAATMGAAANDSRDRAEAIGWARKADITGISKGLVGAGNASYGLATNANNSATASTNGATGVAASTLGTPLQYGSLGVSGLAASGRAYGDIYNQASSALQYYDKQMNDAMGTIGKQVQGIFAGRGGK
jgi:hypothetical protein